MVEQYRNGLDEGKPQARAALAHRQQIHGGLERIPGGGLVGAGETAVDMGRLRALGKAITSYPADWVLHPRVLAVMQARERMVNGDLALDWAPPKIWPMPAWCRKVIRAAHRPGSGRGTFFHRHAVLHDQATGRLYVPLQHLATNQPTFQ